MTMRTDSEPRTNSHALVSEESVKPTILSARRFLGSGSDVLGTLLEAGLRPQASGLRPQGSGPRAQGSGLRPQGSVPLPLSTGPVAARPDALLHLADEARGRKPLEDPFGCVE